MRLKDRVAIITGGGQGIGRAIALAYAREGVRLVLASRTASTLNEAAAEASALGADVLTVVADVTDDAQVQSMVQAALDRFGSVEILVNNSGIPGPTRPLWEISPAEWEEVQAVNVRGPYLCCRAVLPHMIAAQRGRIINIGSIAGRMPMSHRTPYTASKAALIGLTRSLAHEAGRYNINVNLISPGAVSGDRIDLVQQRIADKRGISLQQVRDEFVSFTPLRRMIDPAQVAAAAVYLASDEAADVTGEDLNLTAGRYTW